MNNWLKSGLILLLSGTVAMAQTIEQNVNSPWGIASGAEDSGKYPQFNPMLKDAGVSWIRYFAEWRSIQPAQGEWKFEWSDQFVANCRENQMSVAGIFLYFAPWASADGKGQRTFPVKDMAFFREYVRTVATRYKNDVRYWEVWNEPNSPAFNQFGTPKHYAEMVKAAYAEVKKIDPQIKIGITVASHDLRWLSRVIEDGAADHFDYVCVHPYNSIGLVQGSEQSFLTLRDSTRKMLDSHKQKQDIEIWISEIGKTTTEAPQQLALQAEMLVKAYLLGVVQGFEKVFWFEAMGGKYGDGVHAIINDHGKPYPAYDSLKAMTHAIGRQPKYLGWLNLNESSYGFVFESPDAGATLAVWGAKRDASVSFKADVSITDIQGKATTLRAGEPLQLTGSPLFVKNIPADLVAAAKDNRAARFPWVPDYRQVDVVSAKLGSTNEEKGLRQGNNDPRDDGVTIAGTFNGETYRSTDIGKKRPFIYFEVDRSFMDWGDTDCEITVVARRANPAHPANCTIVYESQAGYHEYGKRAFWPGLTCELLPESETYRAPEMWYLAPGEDWQEKTWRIKDANFIGKWGWNFQINVEQSAGDVWVKEVRVKRLAKSS